MYGQPDDISHHPHWFYNKAYISVTDRRRVRNILMLIDVAGTTDGKYDHVTALYVGPIPGDGEVWASDNDLLSDGADVRYRKLPSVRCVDIEECGARLRDLYREAGYNGQVAS